MNDFIVNLNNAIDEKIALIESPDYEEVPVFSKTSFIASFACILVCTISIIIVYNTLPY